MIITYALLKMQAKIIGNNFVGFLAFNPIITIIIIYIKVFLYLSLLNKSNI